MIVVTALNDEVKHQKVHDLGAVDYILKPDLFERLPELLNQHLPEAYVNLHGNQGLTSGKRRVILTELRSSSGWFRLSASFQNHQPSAFPSTRFFTTDIPRLQSLTIPQD